MSCDPAPAGMTGEPIQASVVQRFTTLVLRGLRATVGIDAVVAATGDLHRATPSIVVAIDLHGDIRGPVAWVFPPEIALELVRRLMDDPDPSPDTATDGATELANILTGGASEALESHGFHCEFGVPRLHIGALPAGVIVHMTSSAGPIDLVLSLSSDGAVAEPGRGS